VDAVKCAVDAQAALAEANASLPSDRRINFRMGVHIGDVMVRAGDLFGDGVNIAARLQVIAKAGGLCVSSATYDQVKKVLSLDVIDLGYQALKNIDEPVRAYEVQMQDRAMPSGTQNSPGGERATRPTLAVLPFDNLGRDNEIEGFCDGLAEDITTALARFRWLNVASRNSSFAQKGRAVDIRERARGLGVRYMLEGSVRKSNGRIRITAQLIDGASGNHVWAERYDRDYSRPFDLQDEIAGDIVASLEYVLWFALARGDHAGAPDRVLSPLRAAAWHLVECTHDDNRTAIQCAAGALKANAKSVAAYQYLVNAYFVELIAGWTEDANADIKSMLDAGRRAAALNPADALSQGLFGCALAYAGDHDDALACMRRALSLNSNSANTYGPCGNVLSFLGEAREANELLERMLRLVPAHYFRAGFLSLMAHNWLQLGEPDRGGVLVREALKLKPEALCCQIMDVEILTALGRSDAAQAAIAMINTQRPDVSRALIRAIFPYRDRSVSEHLADVLQMD
jgi:TolB-like protein